MYPSSSNNSMQSSALLPDLPSESSIAFTFSKSTMPSLWISQYLKHAVKCAACALRGRPYAPEGAPAVPVHVADVLAYKAGQHHVDRGNCLRGLVVLEALQGPLPHVQYVLKQHVRGANFKMKYRFALLISTLKRWAMEMVVAWRFICCCKASTRLLHAIAATSVPEHIVPRCKHLPESKTAINFFNL